MTPGNHKNPVPNGTPEIRILMLEDTPEDAELIEMELDEAGIPFVSERVQTRESFVRALDEFHPHIVLSDYRLPTFDGRAGLAIVRERHPEIPVIMVTGAVGDELAVDLLRAGARDYVLKDRLARLPSAVLRTLSEESETVERKAAEAALRESEHRYKEIFETSPDAIFLIDVSHDSQFTIGDVNHSWEAIMGVRALDVRGHSVEEVLPDVLIAPTLQRYRRCVEGAVTISYEEQITVAGGKRHFHTTLTPLSDESSTVYRLFGVGRDITDRKRAEEALRQSEELYRSFIAASPDGVAVLDPSGKVIFASQKIRELLGAGSEEDLTEHNGFTWIAPEDRQRAKMNVAAIASGATVPSQEYRVLQADGQSLYVEINAAPVPGAGGEPSGIVTTVRDTTERRRAVEALRTSERQLREVYENSPLAYQSLDSNGHYIDINPAWAATFGFTRDEVIGTPFAEHLSPESSELFSRRFPQFKKTGRIHGAEFEMIRKDGSQLEIEMDGRIAHDEDGNFRQAHCILHDITERKQSDLAVRRFNRALKTLSSGNEALVRAANEKDLLTKMCNVLIEHGGYLAAWIGFVSPDNRNRVESVAWAGKGHGSFKEGSTSLYAQEEADPLFEALSDGTPHIIRDMSTDPAYASSREDARAAGFRSSVTLPLKSEAGPLGAVTIYSGETDAFDEAEVQLLAELAEDLTYGIHALRVREDREKSLRRLQATMEATIQALSSTVELRDPYTAGHQRRVAKLAVAIAKEIGLSEDRIHGLFLAAMVHDIGKIHIPAEVLTRPGKLTDVEFALVKTHVSAATDILESVDFPWPIADMVHQHHERMNGSGYPAGLMGDAILMESRILAVSDVVEAMSSHRPYRPGLGVAAALEEIERGQGFLYDGDVVKACISLFKDEGFQFE